MKFTSLKTKKAVNIFYDCFQFLYAIYLIYSSDSDAIVKAYSYFCNIPEARARTFLGCTLYVP